MSTANSFGFFSTVFGFIVAAVSLAAILVKIYLYHLPSNRIKELESLIDQTDTILEEAMEVEDGLLTQPMLVEQAKHRLLVTNTRELRCRIDNAAARGQGYLELLRGTSASIRDACQSVKELRARLMTLIQEGHRNAYEVPLASPPPVLLHNPSLEHHPWSFPSAPISRPSSFSIEIQERGLPPVRRASKGLVETDLWRLLPQSVCTDPSCDRTKSGSDVREADTQIWVSDFHTSVTAEDGA